MVCGSFVTGFSSRGRVVALSPYSEGFALSSSISIRNELNYGPPEDVRALENGCGKMT